MSVESRKNTSNRYVTRVRRVGKSLRKSYVGPANDPVVDFFQRTKDLNDADDAAAKAQRRDEITQSKQLEPHLESLAKWSNHWKVLRKLVQRVRDCPDPDQPTPLSRTAGTFNVPDHFPGIKRFAEHCRKANKGDQDAKAQIQRWTDAVPGLLDDATSHIHLARCLLIDFLARDSAETRALLDLRLDEVSADLIGQAGDDPLLRLYADAVILCYFDLMRCSVAGSRVTDDTKSAKYWDQATNRTQRRWIQITRAFTQQTKQIKKQTKN